MIFMIKAVLVAALIAKLGKTFRGKVNYFDKTRNI